MIEKNLTTGSVFRNVILFSLPYLLSYFLQTLYGMADLFIIGQFGGVAETTAVSVGSQVMHMLTVMIVGLAMGTTVCIGQAVGAGDSKRAAKDIGNTVILFMAVSLALTVLLLLLVRPIVSVMSTPTEAADGTAAYLTICFIGIPFITAYNTSALFSAGWGTAKARCISLRWLARQILRWTIFLWVHSGWDRRGLRSEQRFRRRLVWRFLYL